MPSVDLICLANSYKTGSRCLAGLRVDGGGWVRPVSNREHGEVQYSQYRLPDHSEPHLFDVIRVGLLRAAPAPHQPENWLVDGSAWELVERPAAADRAYVVAASVYSGSQLFGDTRRSAPLAQFRACPARESLALIAPADIRWRTEFSTYELRNMPRVLFQLGDVSYNLPLTDPAYAGPLQRRDEGDYRSSDLGIPENRAILLTVSLGDPFGGICYNLVAAVAVVPPEWPPSTAPLKSGISNSASPARSAG
jgi:hypothetical protein